MANPTLTQVVLDDFSPGIWDDWQAGGGPLSAPHGAAQLTGTFGCVSARGGGLQPGPKRVNRILETLIDADGAGKYPTNDNRMHITSFRALSPVWSRSGVAASEVGRPNLFPDQLFFGFEWYYKGAANFVHKQRVRLYKVFLQAAANPGIGTVATFDIIANATATEYAANFVYGYTSVDLSRSNSLDRTIVGYAIAACMAVSNRDTLTRGRVCYPDDQANTADGTRGMAGLDQPGGFSGYALFGHQDRVVLLDRSINFGMGANGEVPTDMFIATNVNDVTTTGVALENFVAENPGLMGAWASVNASEALMVKQQKGGFALRGDIAYPTVVRLPGLVPTYDAINIPAIAANGMVVYGSHDGVYGWAGSGVSAALSKQLSGWFWKVPGGANSKDGVDQYLHTKGSFAAMGQYVAAPNNFLLDTASGGWWRLTNPAAAGERPYLFHDVSAANFLIAVPAYVDAANQVLADYYDFQQGQSVFSWNGQPLKVSQNRTLDFREVDLMSIGAGTVTITLTGIDGTTDNVVFTTTATTQPELQSLPISCRTHDVIVNIHSDSGSGAAAPRIFRVGLGHHPRETARATST